MSGTMPNSVIDKAALAITKLQGQDNWLLWSTMIHIALGQTWAYVDGSKPHLLTMPTQSMKHGPEKIIMLTGDYSLHLVTMSNKLSSSMLTSTHQSYTQS